MVANLRKILNLPKIATPQYFYFINKHLYKKLIYSNL
jgi:hypothetical protein